MSEKGNGWIYVNPYPEYEELFKRILGKDLSYLHGKRAL